ncbi:hypothetical protein FisN_2HuN34 [Fistulifera solaris]|jgi:hypothetical protein|uniref:Uncharacterized protein n=1 Tax=Fistulifera solaris TaxID=1519565 RepID=A0A1Z5JI42_FISSO|nr:hypothetical protein FisN_2HuN34 [Fistulifera solaris]|eukprot:GAX13683.1 hypothetical protein FisN_2HuN34 [Fistulifera solaris]
MDDDSILTNTIDAVDRMLLANTCKYLEASNFPDIRMWMESYRKLEAERIRGDRFYRKLERLRELNIGRFVEKRNYLLSALEEDWVGQENLPVEAPVMESQENASLVVMASRTNENQPSGASSRQRYENGTKISKFFEVNQVHTEFDGEVISFDESNDGSGRWFYTIRYNNGHVEYLLDDEVSVSLDDQVSELLDDDSENSGLVWVRDGKEQHPAILDKTKSLVNKDEKTLRAIRWQTSGRPALVEQNKIEYKLAPRRSTVPRYSF